MEHPAPPSTTVGRTKYFLVPLGVLTSCWLRVPVTVRHFPFLTHKTWPFHTPTSFGLHVPAPLDRCLLSLGLQEDCPQSYNLRMRYYNHGGLTSFLGGLEFCTTWIFTTPTLEFIYRFHYCAHLVIHTVSPSWWSLLSWRLLGYTRHLAHHVIHHTPNSRSDQWYLAHHVIHQHTWNFICQAFGSRACLCLSIFHFLHYLSYNNTHNDYYSFCTRKHSSNEIGMCLNYSIYK